MRLLVIYTFVFLLVCVGANAQGILEGRVFDYNTNLPLNKVNVSNVNSGRIVLSDSTGRFKVRAQKGDVLALHLSGYVPDTVLLLDLNPREFHLQIKAHQLNAVEIKGVKINSSTWVDDEFHGQTARYQYNKDGSRKGGLVFRFWYWNKDSRKERRMLGRLKNYELQDEIDRLFNLAFIAEHIPLKGTDLLDFRSLYRPSVKLYKSPGFNMLLYLNDSYREFISLPPEKRKLPPLAPFAP
ncbi:MAG: hypothetical protein H7Y13_09650 [Sphingobacteriaceae bacterium]|nr:hypothetical protein [Sphingobacteriaceae bacterium]